MKRRNGDEEKRRLSAIRVVFVTAPKKEAEALARALVKERLAACANLLPGVTSLYWWKGKLERSAETLIVLKAPAGNMCRLLKRLKELHSYTVPEFLALPVMEANPAYVKWVREEADRLAAPCGN